MPVTYLQYMLWKLPKCQLRNTWKVKIIFHSNANVFSLCWSTISLASIVTPVNQTKRLTDEQNQYIWIFFNKYWTWRYYPELLPCSSFKRIPWSFNTWKAMPTLWIFWSRLIAGTLNFLERFQFFDRSSNILLKIKMFPVKNNVLLHVQYLCTLNNHQNSIKTYTRRMPHCKSAARFETAKSNSSKGVCTWFTGNPRKPRWRERSPSPLRKSLENASNIALLD